MFDIERIFSAQNLTLHMYVTSTHVRLHFNSDFVLGECRLSLDTE
jgi:hypothetical protein